MSTLARIIGRIVRAYWDRRAHRERQKTAQRLYDELQAYHRERMAHHDHRSN